MDQYDRDGQPVDLLTWARLLADRAYVRVARTIIAPAADLDASYDVSTVWLGINTNWRGGPPLIFETMVFGDDLLDLTCYRYATEADARQGHEETVTVVAATLDDPVIMDAAEWEHMVPRDPP